MNWAVLNSGISALTNLHTRRRITENIHAIYYTSPIIVGQNTNTYVIEDITSLYTRTTLLLNDDATASVSKNIAVFNRSFSLLKYENAAITAVMNVTILNMGSGERTMNCNTNIRVRRNIAFYHLSISSGDIDSTIHLINLFCTAD